jgi:hypothetical protein
MYEWRVFNPNFKRWMLIGSLSLALVGCGKDEPASSTQPIATGNSSIAVVVNPGAGNCATGTFTVQLLNSAGQAVQSTSVAPGGSATFSSIAAGTYTVRATGQSGCQTDQAVTATASQTSQVSITLNQSGYQNQNPTPYPSSNPYNSYNPYPNTNPYVPYPNQPQQPNPFYNGGQYGGYYNVPYGYTPYWLYGPRGYGYYYYNYGAYQGPCTYNTGSWLCMNTF